METFKITQNNFNTIVRVKAESYDQAIKNYCKDQLLESPVWCKGCDLTGNQFYKSGNLTFELSIILKGEY